MPPAVIIALAGAAAAGSTMYSASQERKSAEKAIESQERIASQQLQSVKDSEATASETAKSQLKAARARKTDTILTTPLGANADPMQINQNTILGVPS